MNNKKVMGELIETGQQVKFSFKDPVTKLKRYVLSAVYLVTQKLIHSEKVMQSFHLLCKLQCIY